MRNVATFGAGAGNVGRLCRCRCLIAALSAPEIQPRTRWCLSHENSVVSVPPSILMQDMGTNPVYGAAKQVQTVLAPPFFSFACLSRLNFDFVPGGDISSSPIDRAIFSSRVCAPPPPPSPPFPPCPSSSRHRCAGCLESGQHSRCQCHRSCMGRFRRDAGGGERGYPHNAEKVTMLRQVFIVFLVHVQGGIGRGEIADTRGKGSQILSCGWCGGWVVEG